jgi:hypothetical protein
MPFEDTFELFELFKENSPKWIGYLCLPSTTVDENYNGYASFEIEPDSGLPESDGSFLNIGVANRTVFIDIKDKDNNLVKTEELPLDDQAILDYIFRYFKVPAN